MNKMNQLGMALSTVAALTLGACATPMNSSTAATPAGTQAALYDGTGVVQSIDVVQEQSSGIGAGTVIGGVLGGIAGNQIGEGTGNTAATVLGAAGGAYAGNKIENARQQADQDYRVTVRMDRGGYQSITQEESNNLRVGDRVRVENGQVIRY